MSNLRQTIKQDMIQALKAGDSGRVSALRFLLSEIQKEGISKYGAQVDETITDEFVTAIIRKSIKSRLESYEAFAKAGRENQAQQEKNEATILKAYIPEELSDEAIVEILEAIRSSGVSEFGLLMKEAKTKIGTNADGSRIAALAKRLLENK